MDYNKIEKELKEENRSNKLFNYLSAGYTGGFENEGVRRSLLVNLFAHIALLSVTGFMLKAFFDGKISYALILLTFFVLCLSVIFIVNFKKNYKISSVLMTSLMYLLSTVLIIVGGDQSTAILWVYSFPVVAFFSIGRKQGLYFAVLAFITFATLLFFEPIKIAEYTIAFKVRFTASYAVLNLLLYVYEYIREKTYNALQESNEKKTYYLNQVLQQKEEIIAQTEKLEEANIELEKLSLVASKTTNSVVIFDNNGDIEWVNDGFIRMNGYNLEEFIKDKGKNIIELSNNPDITRVIKTCFNEKKTVTYAINIINRFNNRLWIQTTLTPILDLDGNIFKVIAIDADVTKVKEAEEEIQQQKEELVAQSELLLSANKALEKNNILITDSINYAKRIQDALFPKNEVLTKYFNEYLLFFSPRNIVSGDFYWLTEVNDKIFISAADCTGHGVPGAFMSIIGISLLNQIIKEAKLNKANEILENLDIKIKQILSNDGHANEQYDDGMDISICVIDKKNKKIEIASANQTVYLIIDKQIKIISGDLYSIGESINGNNEYSNNEIYYNTDISIYMCSDGFQDQFGGPRNKKITEQGLKTLIFEISDMPFIDQQNEVKTYFNNWKGNLKQTDDVMVLGFRISN